jgi:hypothetical protein
MKKTIAKSTPLKSSKAASAAKRKAGPKPAAKPPVSASKPTPKATLAPKPAPAKTSLDVADILAELKAIRGLLEKPAGAAAGTLDEVDAVRRVIGDLMEARMEQVIRDIVSIRNAVASLAGANVKPLVAQVESLLADLGAIRFEAEPLEHVDPLIHAVTREAHEARVPDGVIVESLRPGFTTGRGAIVAKALVSVNRRP